MSDHSTDHLGAHPSTHPDTHLIRDLAAGRPDEATTLVALHERLVTAAAADGSLDLGYRFVDSPVGRLLLAASDLGLVRIAYDLEDHERVLEHLGVVIGSRILRDDKRFDALTRQLDAYFSGAVRAVDVPLDLRLARGFRLEILEHLRRIPYGATETYREVATASGRPRAVRAVGTACATNPVPIVVPCHRVVRSDGSMGGYLGGPAAKQFLLDLESAA